MKAMEGHPYGNNEDSLGITFGDISDEQGVGSSSHVVGNYQSYVEDPIRTSDMVYSQETAQSTEEQVARPSSESLPKNRAFSNVMFFVLASGTSAYLWQRRAFLLN
ncbi:hypothetical protein HID58_051131 [Brassica napus]|uniref:(rape) hypothetical protein n=1 Tax=Brassica napus TaxID=3708 RepID=A0A816HZ12_BRANA|nr:hypothetical protein HID58_051131 [Brassica napus]CAF1698351.1 unnamed protein product [Brassica napus]